MEKLKNVLRGVGAFLYAYLYGKLFMLLLIGLIIGSVFIIEKLDSSFFAVFICISAGGTAFAIYQGLNTFFSLPLIALVKSKAVRITALVSYIISILPLFVMVWAELPNSGYYITISIYLTLITLYKSAVDVALIMQMGND